MAEIDGLKNAKIRLPILFFSKIPIDIVALRFHTDNNQCTTFSSNTLLNHQYKGLKSNRRFLLHPNAVLTIRVRHAIHSALVICVHCQ